MADDPQIISLLGELKAQMEAQQKSMDIICSFKDTALKTFQNFDDYKESRKELPSQIQELQRKTAACNQECAYRGGIFTEYKKKVDFLMLWSGRAMALLFAIGIINMLLIALGRLIDIEYTMK